MSLYWLDFEYQGEKIRIEVEAVDIDEAKKRAQSCLKVGFKYVAAHCVR